MTESTPAIEYIGDGLDGPPLRPEDLFARAEMSRVTRFMDDVVALSLAKIASNRLAAPRFAGKDPTDLKASQEKGRWG